MTVLTPSELAKKFQRNNSAKTLADDLDIYTSAYESKLSQDPENTQLQQSLGFLRAIFTIDSNKLFSLFQCLNLLQHLQEQRCILDGKLKDYLQLLSDLSLEECDAFLNLKDAGGLALGMLIAQCSTAEVMLKYLVLLDKVYSKNPEKLFVHLNLQKENSRMLGMYIARCSTAEVVLKYLELLDKSPPEELSAYLDLQDGWTLGMLIVRDLKENPEVALKYLELLDKLSPEKLSAHLDLRAKYGWTLGMRIVRSRTKHPGVVLKYLKLLEKLSPEKLSGHLHLQDEEHKTLKDFIIKHQGDAVRVEYAIIALPHALIDLSNPIMPNVLAEMVFGGLRNRSAISQETKLICLGRLIELKCLTEADAPGFFESKQTFKNNYERAAFLYRKARQLNPASDTNYYLASLIADEKIEGDRIQDDVEGLELTTTPTKLALALLLSIPEESLIYANVQAKSKSIIESSTKPSKLAATFGLNKKSTTLVCYPFAYLFEKGWQLNEKENYSEAKSFLEEAVKQKRDSAALMQLAWAYRSLGYSNEATTLYSEVICGNDADAARKDRAKLQIELLIRQQNYINEIALLNNKLQS